MSLEEEAKFLRAGTRAGLIDPEKGTAALLLYSQLLERGAQLSFADLLLDRGLITRVGLEALENQQAGHTGAVRTISQLDEFELHEVIGEGASGTVFRALPLPEGAKENTEPLPIQPGSMVALKVLAPTLALDTQAVNTFLNEGYLCSRIAHPNIVRVYRVGAAEGLYYMVMELVEGGSARKLVDKSDGKLPERRALEITAQIASGLAAAHANNLIHRDVKPENILLTAQGVAKLADLGLVLRVGAGDGNDGGEFSGTPGYVAPEVILGEAMPSPASDLFALGATLYDLLTGYPPFMGGSPEEMLRQTLQAPAPSVRALRPDCSQAVENMINMLLLKDPKMRPGNAQQVANELLKIVHLMNGHNAMAAQLGVPIKMPKGLPISGKPKMVSNPVAPAVPATPPAPPRTSVPPPAQRVQWKDPLAARSNTGNVKRPSTGAFLPAPDKTDSKKKIPTRPAHQNPPRKPGR